VTEKEREVASESLFTEIAEKVSEMPVNPQLKAKEFPIDRCKSIVKIIIPIEIQKHKFTMLKITKMAR